MGIPATSGHGSRAAALREAPLASRPDGPGEQRPAEEDAVQFLDIRQPAPVGVYAQFLEIARTLSQSRDEERSAVFDRLIQSAETFVDRLRQREAEFARIMRLTEHVNRGLTLEEVLDCLYDEAKDAIPYDRIGLSLIDPARGVVVARWARSDRPLSLPKGYEAPLAGSTLQRIIETRQPRVINDLEAYLRAKPDSKSTILILREGMRSSLTCPLIVQDNPVGFVFFSSVHPGTYSNVHVGFFRQIAGQLSAIVEKSRLYGDLAQQNAMIEKQNLAMTRDLDMARLVQQALIPHHVPQLPGLEIAFDYEPVDQVGGDLLDIIPLGDGRVFFFVGDAMGHGVRAALVMSVAKAAIYSAVPADPSPVRVLSSVNKALERLFGDYFVTAACCLMDPRTRRAELALGGGEGPWHFKARTSEIVQEGSPALPLGISEATPYEAATLELDPGDALVFFTDGLIEAPNRLGKQYGDVRLKAEVLRHGPSSAAELCAGIRRDFENHCRDCTRADDLTLLVVKLVDGESHGPGGGSATTG
jgi:serine phosphatase RsbU (regulator of sigma subunit)